MQFQIYFSKKLHDIVMLLHRRAHAACTCALNISDNFIDAIIMIMEVTELVPSVFTSLSEGLTIKGLRCIDLDIKYINYVRENRKRDLKLFSWNLSYANQSIP